MASGNITDYFPSRTARSRREPPGPGPARPQHTPPSARQGLVATAKETLTLLKTLPAQLPNLDLTASIKYSNDIIPRLNPNRCPAYPSRARIKVINEDTYNAAIQLTAIAPTTPTPAPTSQFSSSSSSSPSTSPRPPNPRVAVLNFANHRIPGGGWLNGAIAQEEALFYRSSLPICLTLSSGHYPFSLSDALYSPDVVVFRSDMSSGHALLLPATAPRDLPVVSVLTVAAINLPKVHTFLVKDGPQPPREKNVFASDRERSVTKAKMRLTLRMAAKHRHGRLVLGALGCGAFGNPPEDVAHCWREVLDEDEFSGGWWEEVWFAVYDRRNDGNFDIFNNILDGKQV